MINIQTGNAIVVTQHEPTNTAIYVEFMPDCVFTLVHTEQGSTVTFSYIGTDSDDQSFECIRRGSTSSLDDSLSFDIPNYVMRSRFPDWKPPQTFGI